LLERLLSAWVAHRATPDESFFAFAVRHDIAALRALAERAPSPVPVQAAAS
jgi:ferredoxin-nitrite reductase